MVYKCGYLDNDGQCTHIYKGFACVWERCEYYKKIIDVQCPYKEGRGYCTKFKRFHCPGEDKCEALEEYLEDMERKTVKEKARG